MEFIALLSSGKGTWGQVAGLIKRGKWDKIILVCTSFSKQIVSKFDFAQSCDLIEVDLGKPIVNVIEDIKKKLKGKINGTEVALSISSGSGKEHMALISSLLQLPVGIRFSVLTKDGIVYF